MRNDFESNYLAHHGILGMKWGIRRYQNPDGSLTDAGRARYGVADGGSVNDISSSKGYNRRMKDLNKAIKKNEKARGKQYSKIANNPENFLGMNKKHAKKIEEHSENIRKGEAEIERLRKKAESEGYDTRGKTIKADKTVSKIESSFGKNLPDYRKEYGDDIGIFTQKIGKDNVRIEVDRRSSYGKDNVSESKQESARKASEFLSKFDREKAVEGLAKEWYDSDHSWISKDPDEPYSNYVSRDEFKNRVSISDIEINTARGTYTTWWDDDGMYGYHSFTDDGNLSDLKVKKNGRGLQG